ncbi:MAG TPA: serine hydrolase domain-containing protein [Chthonomonadaceae bacterium]|nr:serine hydrolase domain-containing protein [Chthonomonadaceae bacterium]
MPGKGNGTVANSGGTLGEAIGALICALSLFAASAAAAQPPDDRLASELEPIITAEMKAEGVPGAAIGIVRGGKILLAKGFGVTSIETGVPVTADTLFRLGSTTKMFTAAALVQMALAGKLDFHRPIGEYVRGLDRAIARLTVDQLLSHTAGLRNDDPPSERAGEEALGKVVRAWKADQLIATPGEVFSYSNNGYWLAGYVAEAVDGKPYASVVEAELLRPLGMTRSTFRLDTASTYPLALGHRVSGGKTVVVRPIPDNPAGWPSGALFSTANDLCRWLLALTGEGRLEGKQALRKGLVEQLAAAHANVPSTHSQYGYGLSLAEYRGFKVWEHGGGRAGYGSFLRIFPAPQVGIVILTNGRGSQLPKTVERASELLLPLQPKARAAPPAIQEMTPAEMSDYVGVYNNGGESGVEIFVREGRLFLRAEKSEFPLSKIGERRLMMKLPDAAEPDELVMLPDRRGRIVYIQVGSGALKRIK